MTCQFVCFLCVFDLKRAWFSGSFQTVFCCCFKRQRGSLSKQVAWLLLWGATCKFRDTISTHVLCHWAGKSLWFGFSLFPLKLLFGGSMWVQQISIVLVVSDGIIIKWHDSIEGFVSYSHLFSVPHKSNGLRLEDFFAWDARKTVTMLFHPSFILSSPPWYL